MWSVGVQIHAFACGCPTVPASFVKKTILSPLNGLGILTGKQLSMDIWVYLWTLNSIPYVYPYASTILSWLWQFWSFEVRKHEISNSLFFPPKNVLAIPSSLHFPMHLGISLSISAWAHWDSDRDCTESVDQLGEYCHLNNIKSSVPWTWDVFPFLYVLNFFQ